MNRNRSACLPAIFSLLASPHRISPSRPPIGMAQSLNPATPAATDLGRRLKRAFFGRSVHEVAPDLIAATLLLNGVGGIIVDVEAYHHTDPAARSFRGPSP